MVRWKYSLGMKEALPTREREGGSRGKGEGGREGAEGRGREGGSKGKREGGREGG